MEEFASILQRDYGLKPQGKTAPIAATKGNGSGSGGENGNWREGGMARAGRNGSSRGSVLDQNSDDFGDDLFGLGDNGNVKPPGGRSDATLDPFGLSSSSGYDDVFGGPPKYSSPKFAQMSNHDDIFRVGTKPQPAMSKNANLPVFDTPVYDDDIFGGVPGVRSSAGVFDDVFNGGSAAPSVSLFDDLLGGYSAGERKVSRTPSGRSGLRVPTPAPSSAPAERDSIFDDLLSGVGSVESSKPRWSAEGKPPQQPESRAPADKEVLVEDAPGFVDPIISIMKQAPYPWMNDSQDGFPEDVADSTPSDSGAGLDGSFEYYQPTYESYFPRSSRPAKEGRRKDVSSSIFDSNINDVFQAPVSSPYSDPPAVFVEPDRVEAAYFPKVSRTAKDTKQNDFGRSAPNMTTEDYGFPLFEPNVDVSSVQLETETGQAGEEQWLTVDEVQLVTAPSTTPPPYRQAPSWPNKRHVFPPQTYFQQEQSVPDYKSESSSQDTAEDLPFYQQPRSPPLASTVENEVMAAAAAKGIGGLEEFMASVLHKSEASSWPQEEASGANDGTGYQGEMKDNLNRGEVKLRQAKEAREKVREDKKREARGVAREKEGKEAREQILREAREKQERDREKQEKEKQIKEEKERERQKKERLKEREREREKDRAAERAAVERATSEARERAAIEARERAERAAVEKAAAEARERAAVEAKERAERAAVERAAAEARERAAAEAKERAERTAAAIEARQKVERAAVERATAEARERAAAEARARATADARARAERAATESVAAEVRERAAERAAAEARERAERAASERAERAAAERAREQQRRNDNDLDKLFNMGTRANSEPRQRPQNFDFTTDQRTSQAFGSEGQMRPPSSAPGVRKVPSTTNIDDWTSLFAPSAAQDEFQEIEGETPDRRRARLERHQRTMERAAKALADKNQRDLENQFEQAEKQRAGEVLDMEIKRWAAGKEGNLRALLSTLQYVLWPECGWQPVSLTDIINAIAVKKAYRKATLCVHPDKVQQKGATVQQKYIAEKVFDLLKEAWNKFNSEELF